MVFNYITILTMPFIFYFNFFKLKVKMLPNADSSQGFTFFSPPCLDSFINI